MIRLDSLLNYSGAKVGNFSYYDQTFVKKSYHDANSADFVLLVTMAH